MTTANRHLGLKLIALALVVTIFATLLPQRTVFWAEDAITPKDVMPTYDYTDYPIDFAEEGELSNSRIDALFEDTDLRTSNSKTLRLNDGTYTLGSYGFNIHFQTSDGFVEYDNTLIRKDGFYSPTVSDIDLSFAFDRPSYGISFEGVRASFELINDNIIPSEAQIAEFPKQEYATKSAELFAVPNAKAQLSYCDILDGVTVSYLIYGRNIKENIVLEVFMKHVAYKSQFVCLWDRLFGGWMTLQFVAVINN